MSSGVGLLTEVKVYTPEELVDRFEKVRFIKGGGEGAVYEVKEKSTGHLFALKIALNNWRVSEDNKQVSELIATILDQGISPHLTRIHELLTVRCAVFAHPALNETDGFFNGESKYNGAGDGTFPRRAMVMELMEGDMQQLHPSCDEISSTAFKVQFASIDIISGQQGLSCAESHKYRNILYRKLEPTDVFNGKSMTEFDFWKYTFNEHTFYLPRPTYLVKLGDCDSWATYPPNLETAPLQILERRLGGDLTIEKVKALFPKPEDSKATILDVFDSSKAKLEVR